MQANQAIRQQDGRTNGGGFDAINALLIEDNAADARLLQEILADTSHIEFRLTHAETLKDGLERLGKTPFDVVLLDLNLPDSTGLASVDNLLAAHARAPVVVMTGNEEEDLGLRAVAAGAQDLLIKGQLDQAMAVRTIRFAVERFNALVRQQYETVRATGEKLQDEIGRIASSLDDAGQNTSSYRESLTNLASELKLGMEGGDVADLIQRLSAATLEMHRHSTQLEGQLKESSQTINALSKDLEETLEAALTDSLTGLSNRKAFDDRLALATADASENGTTLSLLLVDIDHFKRFNDTWGHQVGDQVLRLVGANLRMNVKGKDTAARYGGEELAIILPETAIENAVALAEQIRKAIGSMKIVKKKSREEIGPVTVSIGAAQFRHNESPDDFVARADYALYAAKEAGRNRVSRAAN
ncbi:MAG: diguanylate cyclase [Kiloniellales bacterium]|nr:diguanylate cyclase [Kiloniellales bacterium]MDJ0970580.1 diguanylate cyclase [Kiloniellales bacterium]